MMDSVSIGTVGIVGIGAMGWPIARNLQRRGYPPGVRDVDPTAEANAASAGMSVYESPAAMAEHCDTVIVVVVDADQIEAVLFGTDRLAGVVQAKRGPDSTRLTVVLCSTIAAADTERFCARLAEYGIDTVDAPISGGPARADSGAMAMMVAAERTIFERCRPLLGIMASALYFVGERVGDGARTKLVNNLLAGINLVAGAEALALGARLGLDRRMLFDVIAASSGSSWVFEDRMARALAGDYAARARAVILTKDVGLAVEMAAAAGVPTPLGREALAVFRATVAAGFGDADDAAVIKTIYPEF